MLVYDNRKVCKICGKLAVEPLGRRKVNNSISTWHGTNATVLIFWMQTDSVSQLHKCWLRGWQSQQVHEWNPHKIQRLYSTLGIEKADINNNIHSKSRDQFDDFGPCGTLLIKEFHYRTSWAIWFGRTRSYIGQWQPDMSGIPGVPGWITYKPGNRYLGTQFQWFREKIRNGSAMMRYELTNSMLADGLTKTFDYIKYICFCKIISLKDSGGSNLGE